MPTHRVRVSQPAEEFGELRVGLRQYDEMAIIGHYNTRINGKRNAAIRQVNQQEQGQHDPSDSNHLVLPSWKTAENPQWPSLPCD